MKRVFLDTNVLIDYLAHREPFFEEAAIIVSLAKHKKKGCMSPLCLLPQQATFLRSIIIMIFPLSSALY